LFPSRFRDARKDVEFLERRIGLHLQRLQNQKAPFEAFDHLRRIDSGNLRKSSPSSIKASKA
jgi:hypothetical protein